MELTDLFEIMEAGEDAIIIKETCPTSGFRFAKIPYDL